MKFINYALSFWLSIFATNQIFAQATPFWSENFTNGFPQGWTNEDPSGNKCLWTWCSDPAKGDAEAGCPEIWNTPNNQQKPFAASTATTGFVTMDSDDYGELTINHLSQMTTTAIDCSGKSEVWVQFQTHIGVFGHVADDAAVLRVSTDKVNWTTFKAFKGVTSSVRWSKNPEIPIIDVSAVAANQSTVYLQWQWDGNWDYHWSVDDVELYDKNPTPPNDLSIDEFFYPVSSFATPESQIATDTFAFYARISNKGLAAQSDNKLKVWIENETGFLLHADSILIGQLAVGESDVLVEFSNLYVPKLVQGRYRIHYQISNTTADGRPDDNKFSADFLVTSFQFAKEERPRQSFRPSNAPSIWFVGNYYRMSNQNLEQYKAVSADFAYSTDEDEIKPNAVTGTVYLLKALPGIDDNLNNLDDDDFFNSFEWIGLGEYIAPDTMQNNLAMQSVPILDFNTNELGVLLEKGEKYFLAMGYSTPSNLVYHAFNNDVNYYFTSTLVYTDGFGSFGSDANAVLRMNLSLVVTTDDKVLPAATFQVMPNPAQDFIQLKMDFKYPTNAVITIAQLDGRVISILEKEQLTQENIVFPTNTLAAGTYLARVATAEGTKTHKFIVVK